MTTKEGQELQQKIGAFAYVECSAKENINLTNVLEEAVRATVASEKLNLKKKNKSCQIA